MKKKMLLCLCMMCLLTGCLKKDEKVEETPIDESVKLISEKKEELTNKLLEYGKMIYDNDYWLNGNIEPMVYYMTLSEMEERNKYDISMFYNPVTNKKCDKENTRIEFIVKEKTENKTKYEYNPVLDCDFE